MSRRAVTAMQGRVLVWSLAAALVGAALVLLLAATGVPVVAEAVGTGLTAILPIAAFAASASIQSGLLGRPTALSAAAAGVGALVVQIFAVIVFGGLGSGDPLLGPTLALAMLATPTPWLLAALQAVAAIVARNGRRVDTGSTTSGGGTR